MPHQPEPAILPVVEPARDQGIRDAAVRDEQTAVEAGMRLLSAGVPLTLLLDLSLPVDSQAISAAEGGSASWLPS